VLPWLVLALLFASLAHAVHRHQPEALGHNDALHCGLCVQFERLAGAPDTPQPIPFIALVTWTAPIGAIEYTSALLALPYDARGPPRT
jgi:hypothetical protein